MQNHIAEMRKIARHLSQSPGVYLMKDRLGQVIYVGKAKNLRKRVSSYFQGSKKFIWAQPKIVQWFKWCEKSPHMKLAMKQHSCLRASLSKIISPDIIPTLRMISSFSWFALILKSCRDFVFVETERMTVPITTDLLLRPVCFGRLFQR